MKIVKKYLVVFDSFGEDLKFRILCKYEVELILLILNMVVSKSSGSD